MNYLELEARVDKLERAKCCSVVFYDTLPATGKKNVLYIDKATGDEFIWDGSAFSSVGGGGGITDVTYDELVALINSNGLTAGAQYRITDFATVHYLINPSATNQQDITVKFTGNIEQLIVTAISVNQINALAYSEAYPYDIIRYDWNPQNWLTDIAFSDITFYDYVDPNTASIIDNFKGVIYHREDTINRNKFGYDFRNVKFRRWKINPPAWSNVTGYVKRDTVLYNSKVYVALKNGTSQTPSTISSYWIEIIDLSVTDCKGYQSGTYNGLPIGSNDFMDMLTFSNMNLYSTNVIDNDFLNVNGNAFISNFLPTILPNNVFLINHSYDIMFSNKFSTNTVNNTFEGYIEGNIFKAVYNNIFGDAITNNTLCGVGFSIFRGFFDANFTINAAITIYNSLFGTNISNNIFYNFSNNVVADAFRFNKIEGNVSGCFFKKSFVKNNIDISASLINLDFNSATHVYLEYDKHIYTNSSFVNKLRYYDNSDVVQIVDPTT